MLQCLMLNSWCQAVGFSDHLVQRLICEIDIILLNWSSNPVPSPTNQEPLACGLQELIQLYNLASLTHHTTLTSVFTKSNQRR